MIHIEGVMPKASVEAYKKKFGDIADILKLPVQVNLEDLGDDDEVLVDIICKDLNSPMDFELLALVDYTGAAENEDGRVYVADDIYLDIAKKYQKNVPVHCDCCHYTRKRNKLYIFLNVHTGDILTVGDSCYNGFLNLDLYNAMVKEFQKVPGAVVYDVPFGEEDNDKHKRSISYILGVAQYFIQKDGFLSKKEAADARRLATYSQVIKYIDEGGEIIPKSFWTYGKKAAAWFDNMVDVYFNDTPFAKSVKNIIHRGYVEKDEIGTLVYGLVCAKKYAAAEKRLKKESEHIGSLGEIITDTFTVSTVSVKKGKRGGCYRLICAEDKNNNMVTWCWAMSMNPMVGDIYTVTAKVIEHKNYNNRKYTVLSSCKVLSKEAVKDTN